MALTLTCPVCGKRNGYEFRYGGEDKGPRPDEAGIFLLLKIRIECITTDLYLRNYFKSNKFRLTNGSWKHEDKRQSEF